MVTLWIPEPDQMFFSSWCCLSCPGSILAAKAKSDDHLKEAKKEAKRIIHAFHKARDRKVALEVSAVHVQWNLCVMVNIGEQGFCYLWRYCDFCSEVRIVLILSKSCSFNPDLAYFWPL